MSLSNTNLAQLFAPFPTETHGGSWLIPYEFDNNEDEQALGLLKAEDARCRWKRGYIGQEYSEKQVGAGGTG